MSGGGGNDNDTLHDSSIGWGLLAIIAALLIWLFWYFFHEEVRDIIRWIRYGYMVVIAPFVSDDYTIMFNGVPVNFEQGYEATPKYAKSELKNEHVSYFGALAMQPLKYPFAILMGLGAIWCVFKGPKTSYRSHLGLEGLIQRQSQNFAVIAPFVKFNPSTLPYRAPGSPVPAELPPFSEALGPEEWVAYHEITLENDVLDTEKVEKKFVAQLKGRWKGPAKLPDYMQVLLAAFCLKASRKRDEADNMLGRMAHCWTLEDGLKLSKDRKLLGEARKILRNKDLAAGTMEKANQHAFLTTAMLSALDHARNEGGVLAPAQFVWLRAHDRTLWYPLNNLGRQSFNMEALGAMAHYKIEKRTLRPIPAPKVEGAVGMLSEYITSSSARPIPTLDYSNSSKRGIKKAK
jgi:intracellular multiplication protein IcmP